MTYNQAYSKIIDAYFKDEIQPYDGKFCFCGTLAYVESFANRRIWGTDVYSLAELKSMEAALLTILRDETIGEDVGCNIFLADYEGMATLRDLVRNHPNYENALFNGMAAALDVLKQIHLSRGETVDPRLTLDKRQLKCSTSS